MADASFFRASEARDAAIIRKPAIDEISAIQSKIIDAILAGALDTIVGPGATPPVASGLLANSSVAYAAWSDPVNNQTSAHKVAAKQMNDVIAHFSKLGYLVKRAQHQTGTTFNWIVQWG